jgi:hypothetical protein
MDTRCREQTHDTAQRAQGHLSEGAVFTERTSGWAVDATRHTLQLAQSDKSAEHDGRQCLRFQIARAQQGLALGEHKHGFWRTAALSIASYSSQIR